MIGPKFMLYDGRARGGDTERAVVMDTAETEQEARREGNTTWRGHDAVWYECKVIRQETRSEGGRTFPVDIVEETIRADLPPANQPPRRR